MASRFDIPIVGPPAPVSFPPVVRSSLAGGLRLWTVPHTAVPVVTFTLVLEGGTTSDPPNRHGLASLVASLATEGAGTLDAIALSDALARLGARIEVQAGAEITTLTMSTITRHADAGLALLGDIVRRPRLEPADFERVRELRLSRLTQASRVASTIADRAVIAAVFADHPYGHGSLGTTAFVRETTIDDVRSAWSRAWTPAGATLIVAGEVDPSWVDKQAAIVLGDWRANGAPTVLEPTHMHPAQSVLTVHRPGAAQAEVRVAHVGPPRRTPAYHALVTLNALFGGQFTSRLNRNLRERRAITYGVRSSFDMRRAGGLFSCDASVQADAAATAVTETLRELREVRQDEAVTRDELDRAQASLTRGYVRHFETAAQLARALVELAAHDLEIDTYDRFVDAVSAVTPAHIAAAAQSALQPDEATVVVVADLDKHGESLAQIGRPVESVTVEF